MIFRLSRLCLWCFMVFISRNTFAQSGQIKVMIWNVLNWPSTSAIASDTALRCPAYRAVIGFTKPDILMTCENNGLTGIPWFRNQVMISATGYSYLYGTFNNGYDSDNAIYYRDSLFQFISNISIPTALRDINQFTLVYKPTGDTLFLFMCHLKAGTGFEADREAEIAQLRAVTNSFPAGRNFLVGGDFNIYSSLEPAYQNLISASGGNNGNFNDVISGMTGIWNSFVYSPYHTQSTRTVIGPGGGSAGGLDDRFDMILLSNSLLQSGGMTYVSGSYTSVGNDGDHYNDSISRPFNSAVPAYVASALQTASDHLPVMLTLQMSSNSSFRDPMTVNELLVYPNPVNDMLTCRYRLTTSGNLTFSLKDITGREVWTEELKGQVPGSNSTFFSGFDALAEGIYLLSVKNNNELIFSKIRISH